METENADTVLEYKNTRPEVSPTTDHDSEVPQRPKRTPTFDDFLTPLSPSQKLEFDSSSLPSGVPGETYNSLLEAGEDSEAPVDPADAVIQLLTEWTTVFDD